MWLIEALTMFGELNLAPIAIGGAAVVMAAATGLVITEKKKAALTPAPVSTDS